MGTGLFFVLPYTSSVTLNKQFRTLFFIDKVCVCNRECAAALIVQSLKHKVLPFLFFICKIRLTSLHLICFVITRMVVCWFISLSFCAVLWKLHSFMTVIYNYHQRQIIFLPWSVLLHIYAIVFIMIPGKQMEFFFVYTELIRNFWGIWGEGALPCAWITVHTMAWLYIWTRPGRHCVLSSPYQVSVLSYEEIGPRGTKWDMATCSRCIYFYDQGGNTVKHIMECTSPMF